MARHYAGNLQHQGIETAVLNTYWADSQAFYFNGSGGLYYCNHF
jgi:hypothetical protein